MEDLRDKLREAMIRESGKNPSNPEAIAPYRDLLEFLDNNPNQARLLLEIRDKKAKNR